MYAVATFVCLAVTFVHSHPNFEKQLNGTIAVVTGGAKGIGYAITDNYLKNGAQTVIIVDKNLQRGLEAEATLNWIHGANRTVFIHGDVTTDLDRVTKKIFRSFRYVNILVNNAGILNESDPVKTINTNALAPVLWSERFFEVMRKDRGGRGGTIMNVASITAYTRDPFIWFYKTSKFAVLGLTFGLGHDYNYLTSGVRMFAICPGFTRTDMTRQQMVVDEQVEVFSKFISTFSWQTADAVGRAAALLYKTAKTGVAYTVQGGQPPVVSPDSLTVTAEVLLSI